MRKTCLAMKSRGKTSSPGSVMVSVAVDDMAAAADGGTVEDQLKLPDFQVNEGCRLLP